MSDLERDLRSLIDGSPAIDADEVRYRTRGNRFHPSRRSNQRPLVAVLAVAALVVLVVAGVALLRSGSADDGSVVVPVQPTPTLPPDQIVTIAEDGRVAVLDRSGNLVQVLGSAADLRPGQLSAAPDGSVYFVQHTPGIEVGGQAAGTIVEVPDGGGGARNVTGQGCCNWYPAASPDGRWLAFSGVPNQSDAGRDILLQSRGGTKPTYDRRWSGDSPLDTGIEILGWSPDSSTVIFVDHDEADPRPRVLDIDTPETASLDEQPLLDLPAGLSFAGYRGDTGQLLLVDRTSAPTRVLAWSPPSGDPQPLFTLDGMTSVSVDPSGDHLLAVTGAGLYRWSTGDAAPVLVVDANEGIVAAAWLPSRGTPRATSPDSTPATSVPAAPITPTTGPQSTAADVGDRPVIQVLNATGIMGAATQRTNDLAAKGWSVAPPENAPETRTGTGIQCVDGYASAASLLQEDLRRFGVESTIEPLPVPLRDTYDPGVGCYVILGR